MNIGIFGGSFNPIHVGHAIIANYIIANCDIDELWLMVTPQNPWKQRDGYVSDYHRLRMVELVSRRLDHVSTSGFEFSLPRPSYTIDTLNALQGKFPADEFTLVIGADNWARFNEWKDYGQILSRYKVLVYPRIGYDISIPPSLNGTVNVAHAPIVDVSSTRIREQLAQRRNMNFYLPSEVYDYILSNHLYLQA